MVPSCSAWKMSPGREQLRRDAELVHSARAEAEEAHLQPAQVLDRLDLAPEPARGLGRDDGAGDVVDAVLAEHLTRQLQPAAVVDPREVLPLGETTARILR